MRRFWKYQVQYRAGKWLVEVGLMLMPDGKYKSEVLEALWTIRARVMATVTNGDQQ